MFKKREHVAASYGQLDGMEVLNRMHVLQGMDLANRRPVICTISMHKRPAAAETRTTLAAATLFHVVSVAR